MTCTGVAMFFVMYRLERATFPRVCVLFVRQKFFVFVFPLPAICSFFFFPVANLQPTLCT